MIAEQEMYGEFFDIPAPDELVFISSFTGGEVFRSGCTFRRGHGKIFYFSPGDQDYPVYHHPDVRRVIANAVEWAVTDRPSARHPELLRYETGEFFDGRATDGDRTSEHRRLRDRPSARRRTAARRRGRRRRHGPGLAAHRRRSPEVDLVGIVDLDLDAARAAPAGRPDRPGR